MKTDSGAAGEAQAAGYLEEKGCEILTRNYRTRFGEIDIIARSGPYILFAEVKTREAGSQVGPLEAVTLSKQRRVIKTAMLYLQSHPTELQPRFDVIAVTTVDGGKTVREIQHLESAFEARGFL